LRTENFTFLSADGKTNIHAVKWFPDHGEFHAILQITHGMIEYIERYRPFAEFLTEKGYLVVGHDHLGHGQSVSTKEDWGYVGLPSPSNLMVEDMHRLRSLIQAEYPEAPYFMLGHSMGSYMLRKYLTIHNKNVNGAIFMGTGMVSDTVTKIGMLTAKILKTFRGWHYRSNFITSVSFGKPYRRFDLTGKDSGNSWLTKDEDIVKTYYADPQCTFRFTLNGYMALFEAVYYDGQPQNAAKIPKDFPIFLVSGKDDPVGDFGEGVGKVYELYKEAGITDITLRLYDNDRHEILNELDRDKVYEDILSWMDERITSMYQNDRGDSGEELA
jgi:alpha-beta hydrolase superfamily lysophospholipase